MDFQIHTTIAGKNVCRSVLDEGASTSITSLSCWRAVGSPIVNLSTTTLNAFDGCVFQPYRLLPSISITLGGMAVSIPVEVVNAQLDYNILLG